METRFNYKEQISLYFLVFSAFKNKRIIDLYNIDVEIMNH